MSATTGRPSREPVLSLALWTGLALGLLGVLLLPWSRAGVPSIAAAALLVFVSVSWPPSTPRGSRRPPSLVDRYLPRYQFHELHERDVRAAPAALFDAIRRVTASEIRFFRSFTWLRNPARSVRPEEPSLLNPPPHRPILEVAVDSGFFPLEEDAESEMVVGVVLGGREGIVASSRESFLGEVDARRVRSVLCFRVESVGEGLSRLSTETRVFAPDRASARRFALYWRLIFPGSWLLRVTWLAAIARRAERKEKQPRAHIAG